MVNGLATGTETTEICLVRFEFLTHTFAAHGVDIIWDRRVGERRQRTAPIGIERRRADRRGPPPVSWDALDFVIVKN